VLCALSDSDTGATNPEYPTWEVSPSTFREGSNSGGPPDSSSPRRSLVNVILKGWIRRRRRLLTQPKNNPAKPIDFRSAVPQQRDEPGTKPPRATPGRPLVRVEEPQN
jgi:hypothetical protein